MSAVKCAMSLTARSKKMSLGIPEPGTFLYLGQNGESALYSDSLTTKKIKRRPRKSKDNQTVEGVAASPDGSKRTFDNNSYAIIKRQLNKSPKMSNYI